MLAGMRSNSPGNTNTSFEYVQNDAISVVGVGMQVSWSRGHSMLFCHRSFTAISLSTPSPLASSKERCDEDQFEDDKSMFGL